MADKKETLFLLLKDKNNFSEPWKNYILKNDGNPLQEDIYHIFITELMTDFQNTLNTGNMSNQDADLYKQRKLPELFQNKIETTMAQIYAWQILLNKRIGRFFYNPEYQDTTLLHNVKMELIDRGKRNSPQLFWIIQTYFKDHASDYKKRVFEQFKKLDEEYNLLVGNHPKPVNCKASSIFKKYKENVTINKFDGSYEKREYITCLFDNFTDVAQILVGSDNLRRFPKLTKFPKDIDNKDILYIIAIIFAMEMDDFLSLKQIASESYRDTSRFEENKFDNRDTMILAIIRNVKDWYWQTIYELSSEISEEDNDPQNLNYYRSKVYEYAMTDLEWKSKVVLGVLTRVDKIIDENGFCTENYDKLLLHNFLIKSNAFCPYIKEKKYYADVFNYWKNNCTDKTRIFDDFYQKIEFWAENIATVKTRGNSKIRTATE